MTFAVLVRAEMRRALHRRFVWGLIALSLVGVGILGLVAFFDSTGKSAAELTEYGTHPAIMVGWWVGGSGDGILMIAAIPLLMGGLLGGASVAGAEWKAGTVTTVLTWEPRRLRLLATRTISAFTLASIIALLLQTVFLASTLPAVAAHGTTAGTDAAWWWSLVAALTRISLVTGGAALVGVALATIGRSTAFALVIGFAWMGIGENLVRGFKPSLQDLLIGDNLAVVLTWAPLDAADWVRSEITASLTLAVYFSVVFALGAVAFSKRDIAGAA